MDIKERILEKIKEKGEVRVSDLVKETGFSRVYINRFFNELEKLGRIVLIGKANKARYIKAGKKAVLKYKKDIISFDKKIANINIHEDVVLGEIRDNTGIFIGLKKNIEKIFSYAFTEILNNAIEHSTAKEIRIRAKKDQANLTFEIFDNGMGIFNNLMKKKKLRSDMEAIQFLTKGKQTTMPEQHSGEGIFFTSKIADIFVIESFKKKIIFNNQIEDVFVSDIKELKGTRVSFTISLKSKNDLNKLFKKYTSGLYEFDKTKIIIKLFKVNEAYLSRSQARRVMYDLEKFKTIIMDFKGVDMVGQAFADEVFRVWQNKHKDIKIIPKNMNENINFMINRVER